MRSCRYLRDRCGQCGGLRLSMKRCTDDSKISSPPKTSDRTNSHVMCQFQDAPRRANATPMTATRNPRITVTIFMESPVGRRIPSNSSRIPEKKIAAPRAIKADAG